VCAVGLVEKASISRPFFGKGPGGEYFQLCGPEGFGCSDLTLPLLCENSHTLHIS
jgi:hypothetical protein